LNLNIPGFFFHTDCHSFFPVTILNLVVAFFEKVPVTLVKWPWNLSKKSPPFDFQIFFLLGRKKRSFSARVHLILINFIPWEEISKAFPLGLYLSLLYFNRISLTLDSGDFCFILMVEDVQLFCSLNFFLLLIYIVKV